METIKEIHQDSKMEGPSLPEEWNVIFISSHLESFTNHFAEYVISW